MQRDMAGLENRANPNGELLTAGATLAKTGTNLALLVLDAL
jgi:hypothetical protein